MRILEFRADDPDLDTRDPRKFKYKSVGYISVMSHLRLVCSADGVTFTDPGLPSLMGSGPYENFGIEDCRVSTMADGEFLLTYTAVSDNGYGIGLRRTRDWKHFSEPALITLPPNKDCAIFEEKIDGSYACLSRPSGVIVGGHYMWYSRSDDLRHWGDHRCVAKPRPGMWDSERIGAGAAPIRTPRGWLEIYHGATRNPSRYCLGALLLDLKEPWRVLARSRVPIMEPLADYERAGFFGNVVFTNGHVCDGDDVVIYYGASDSVICGARL